MKPATPRPLPFLFLKSPGWKGTDQKLWNSSHRELDLTLSASHVRPGFHVLQQFCEFDHLETSASSLPYQAMVHLRPPVHPPRGLLLGQGEISLQTLILALSLVTWEPQLFLYRLEIPNLHRCRLCLNFSGTLQIWRKDLRAAGALAADSKHLAKEIKSEGPLFWLDSVARWAGDDLVTRRLHHHVSHFEGFTEQGAGRESWAVPNEGILYRQKPDIWNV